jgi:hypothetical protein
VRKFDHHAQAAGWHTCTAGNLLQSLAMVQELPKNQVMLKVALTAKHRDC